VSVQNIIVNSGFVCPWRPTGCIKAVGSFRKKIMRPNLVDCLSKRINRQEVKESVQINRHNFFADHSVQSSVISLDCVVRKYRLSKQIISKQLVDTVYLISGP
jgi:hypothetical protein